MITAASKESEPLKRRRVARGRLAVLITLIAVVFGGGAAGIAFGSGLIGNHTDNRDATTNATSPDLIGRLEAMASSSGVTGLRIASISGDGDASVVEGNQNGIRVATLVNGTASTLFAPITTLLSNKAIIITIGARGSSMSAFDELSVAGIASDRVAKVAVVGKTRTLELLDLTPLTSGAKAFSTVLRPTYQPVAVVAYDENGRKIGQEPIPPMKQLEPPGYKR